MVSHIFYKTLVLFIIDRKCGDNNEKIFKEEEWTEIIKILCLVNNMSKSFMHIWFYVILSPNQYIITLKINMVEQNLHQEFRFKM